MSKLSFIFVLAFSISATAQSMDSCGKKTFLFSREIFPESLTVSRGMELIEETEDCENANLLFSAKPVQTARIEPDRYQYWKDFHSRQTPDGLERLYIPTEQLVDRVYYRKP